MLSVYDTVIRDISIAKGGVFMALVYRCREFPRSRLILLPTRWREVFGFSDGDRIDVISNNGQIVIKKADYGTFEHKRYLSPKGGVTIPKEIINQLDISKKNDYCLYVDPGKEQFIIITHEKQKDHWIDLKGS